MMRQSRLSDRVRPVVPRWLVPAGLVAALFGLVLWLVPVQVVRAMLRAGMVPSPEDVEAGLDRLSLTMDTIALVGKVETLGAILAIGGVLVALVVWVSAAYMQPRGVMQERSDLEEARLPPRNIDPKDPMVGAVFVEEEDGEELIVPRRQQGRPSTSERYRTRGYGRIRGRRR